MPQTWTRFAVGVVVGGLAVGWMAPGRIASAHRDEIDGVVADSIRERLVEALGAERAVEVESRAGSLTALVGAAAPATSAP